MQPHKTAAIEQILSIQQFKAAPEDVKELYSRGYALPQFFLNNLVSKERVVKHFTGQLALVQAFYFQLMRFALENEERENKHKKILLEMFVKYDVFGQGQLQDQIFTDFQYRKFFKDFVEIVQKDKCPNFQQKAEEYPIIDEILKKQFKMVVPIPLLAALDDPELKPMQSAGKIFKFLCQLFDITLVQSGPCFKFQQSDTFVYLQQTDEVYLAFNNDLQQMISEESSQLKSTFKCGQGNSFVTKYHSQTSSQCSSKGKPFDKSRYYKTQHSQSEPIAEEQEQSIKETHQNTVSELSNSIKQSPLLTLKHISCVSKVSRKGTLASQQQASSPLIGRFTPGFISLFSTPPPLPPQKQNKQLYTQFTNTFILQQISPKSRDTIQNIKQKYRERTSINTHRF